MTYQESHFPSNQADFRLVLGMVAFSPSSPLPNTLSSLPCDLCPIFCHSEVICDHGEAVSWSLAVCHSQCSVHPEDATSRTPGSVSGFNSAAALRGCHRQGECKATEELSPFTSPHPNSCAPKEDGRKFPALPQLKVCSVFHPIPPTSPLLPGSFLICVSKEPLNRDGESPPCIPKYTVVLNRNVREFCLPLHAFKQ